MLHPFNNIGQRLKFGQTEHADTGSQRISELQKLKIAPATRRITAVGSREARPFIYPHHPATYPAHGQ